MKFLRDFNIEINNKEYYDEALTHSSFANEHNHTIDYERLEYLGDAILEFLISEYYYLNTNFKEGVMSKKRASYVCEQALAFYARKIGLEHYIKVGNGQQDINDTIVADVFEAILGAIYLDHGIDVAKEYIYKTVIPYIEEEMIFMSDYKSHLQELVQTDKKSLEYIITSETGEPHDKVFEVDVVVDNIVYGHGVGKSKKEAEQMAAKNAIEKCAK